MWRSYAAAARNIVSPIEPSLAPAARRVKRDARRSRAPGGSMLIKTHHSLSLDGFAATTDGKP